MNKVIAPPFPSPELAAGKVQTAEDLWNTRDPERVAAAYTEDTQWRNRTEFLDGRAAVVAFLKRKWAGELDYKLRKSSGDSAITAWPLAFNTNGTTGRDSGFAPTVLNYGNLRLPALCSAARQALTTLQSLKKNALSETSHRFCVHVERTIQEESYDKADDPCGDNQPR